MSTSRTLWEAGHESGREVVVLGLALALTVVLLDLSVVGRVSLLFDVGFVALCIGLALAVRRADFFTVGVLPPLIMVAVFAVLAVSRPGVTGAAADGVVPAVVSGLAQHSMALVVGYALCLVCLALRRQVAAAS